MSQSVKKQQISSKSDLHQNIELLCWRLAICVKQFFPRIFCEFDSEFLDVIREAQVF